MRAPLPDVAGAADFREAAERVLAYLRVALPMTFWSVTRVEGGRQSYLYLGDNGYGLQQGGSHRWEGSFCVHMASGAAPAVAPDAQAVPVYARAAVNDAIRIGAYAGAPVRDVDGSLFGAICGLDPEPRADDETMVSAAPVLALLGQLLTSALALDRARDAARRLVHDMRVEADTDLLTGCPNRRGWERQTEDVVATLHRLGDVAAVAVVDLDLLKQVNDTRGHAAGDEHIRRAARALTDAVREGDVVARLGGDEFGLLLRNCGAAAAGEVVDRVSRLLVEVGVRASVGWAPVTVIGGVAAAVAAADAAMYAEKRARRHRLAPYGAA